MKRVILTSALVLASLVLWGCDTHNDDHNHDHNHNHNDNGNHNHPHENDDPDGSGKGTDDDATKKDVVSTTVNKNCPIMGKPVDPKQTVDYNGKKVGFCCKGCAPKWAALSADEKAAKLMQ
ncbi:MAG: hypothetical protein CMJ83_03320 [Planctomycetes bacterium]|nr:hypothetical protein [Planctomycetota bacterium]